ncbi:IS3 family transposase [Streptomyces sp. ISID311]|nr:IS3 family transposase [Streptomyces sp. ISID311]
MHAPLGEVAGADSAALVGVISDQKTVHRVPYRTSCRALGVSEAWFYTWRRRPFQPTQREIRRVGLAERVRCFFDYSGQTYGSPRITLDPCEEGWQVSQNTVADIMAELGLQGRTPPRRRRSLTRPGKRKAAPALMRRTFDAVAPDVLWWGDMTQIDTGASRRISQAGRPKRLLVYLVKPPEPFRLPSRGGCTPSRRAGRPGAWPTEWRLAGERRRSRPSCGGRCRVCSPGTCAGTSRSPTSPQSSTRSGSTGRTPAGGGDCTGLGAGGFRWSIRSHGRRGPSLTRRRAAQRSGTVRCRRSPREVRLRELRRSRVWKGRWAAWGCWDRSCLTFFSSSFSRLFISRIR